MQRPVRCVAAGVAVVVVVVAALTAVAAAAAAAQSGPIAQQISSELNMNQMQLKQVPSDRLCALADERRRAPNAAHVNYLSLAGNQIDAIAGDAFVCVAQRLRIIDLSQNQIRSVAADAFQSLDRVQVLLLDENRLTEVPSRTALGSLRSLRHLSLAGNQIGALNNGTFNELADDANEPNAAAATPKSAAALSALLTLDLRANPLERIDLGALFGLTSLVTLILSQTKLSGHFGPVADARAPLKSLRNIHLDRTANLSSLESTLCAQLPKLATLTLSSNRFKQVPHLDAKCNSLLLIDLSYNLISGKLVADQFRSMPALIDIYLGHNQIDTIELGAFNGLQRLQVLALNNNRLKHIDQNAFVPIGATIYELNLAHNKHLSRLTNFGLENLSSLKVYGNKHLRELPYFGRAQSLVLTYAYHCCDYLPHPTADATDENAEPMHLSAAFWSKLRQILLAKQVSLDESDPLGNANDDEELSADWTGNRSTMNASDGFASLERSRLLAAAGNSINNNNNNNINYNSNNNNNLTETIVWPTSAAPVRVADFADANLAEDLALSDGWRSGRSKRSDGDERAFGVGHLRLFEHRAADLIDGLVSTLARRRRLHSVIGFVGKTGAQVRPDAAALVGRLADAVRGALNGRTQRSSLGSRPKRWPLDSTGAFSSSVLSSSSSASASPQSQPLQSATAAQYGLNRPKSGSLSSLAETSATHRPTCRPKPDAFLPCRDLFDGWWLRAGVWLVFVLGFTGNLLVITVLICVRPSSSASALTSIMWLTHSKRHIDVPRFLVINLAVADLLMALYLGLLAFVDASTYGSFRAYAIRWQHSFGCKLAAFFAVLSSELSVFILAIITLERNYAITNAVHLNRRLSFHRAALIMLIGYAWALCMAILPLEGVSDYRRFSICLPLDYGSSKWSRFYTIALISINGISFLLLFACYLRMYCAIRGSQAWNTNDLRIAKRMSTLVLTDFLCWAPILCVAIASLFGHHLVGSEGLKALTVFVLPLNSVANPFLYAITTKKFKRDLRTLFRRLRSIVRRLSATLIGSKKGQPAPHQPRPTRAAASGAHLHELNHSDPNGAAHLVGAHRCCLRASQRTANGAAGRTALLGRDDRSDLDAIAWRTSKRYRRRCLVHSPPASPHPPPEIHICRAATREPPAGNRSARTAAAARESAVIARQVHAPPEVAIVETVKRPHEQRRALGSLRRGQHLLAACACNQAASPATPPPPPPTPPPTRDSAANCDKPRIVVLDLPTDRYEDDDDDDEPLACTTPAPSNLRELARTQSVPSSSNLRLADKRDSLATLASAPARSSPPTNEPLAPLLDATCADGGRRLERPHSAEGAGRARSQRLEPLGAAKHQTSSCQAILVLETAGAGNCCAPRGAESPEAMRSASACGCRSQAAPLRAADDNGCTVADDDDDDSTRHLQPYETVLVGSRALRGLAAPQTRPPVCLCGRPRTHLADEMAPGRKQRSANSISRLLIDPIARAWSSLHLLSSALHGSSQGAPETGNSDLDCCGGGATVRLPPSKDLSPALSASSSSSSSSSSPSSIHGHDCCRGACTARDRPTDSSGESQATRAEQLIRAQQGRRMSRSCDAIAVGMSLLNQSSDPTSSSNDYYDDRRMLLAATGTSHLADPGECGARIRCARCRSWSPALLRDKLEDCLRKITHPKEAAAAAAAESTCAGNVSPETAKLRHRANRCDTGFVEQSSRLVSDETSGATFTTVTLALDDSSGAEEEESDDDNNNDDACDVERPACNPFLGERLNDERAAGDGHHCDKDSFSDSNASD